MRGLVTCPMDAEDRLRQDSDKIPTPNKVGRNKGPGNEVPKEYQNKLHHVCISWLQELEV